MLEMRMMRDIRTIGDDYLLMMTILMTMTMSMFDDFSFVRV